MTQHSLYTRISITSTSSSAWWLTMARRYLTALISLRFQNQHLNYTCMLCGTSFVRCADHSPTPLLFLCFFAVQAVHCVQRRGASMRPLPAQPAHFRQGLLLLSFYFFQFYFYFCFYFNYLLFYSCSCCFCYHYPRVCFFRWRIALIFSPSFFIITTLSYLPK